MPNGFPSNLNGPHAMPRFQPASVTCVFALLLGLSAPMAIAREWKDSSGKFKVEATFVRIVGDRVELRKPDGKLIQVPTSKLCEDDQKHLKSLVAQSKSGSSDPWLATLDEPCRVPTEGLKLGDFLKALQAEHAISICVGPDIRGEILDEMIGNVTKSAKVGEALHDVLQPADLAWYELDQTLVVVSKEDADQRVSTRVYRLKKPNSLRDLLRSVENSIAPDSWQSAGGVGSVQSFRNESLVIAQSQAIHQEIESRFSDTLVRVRGQVKLDDREKVFDQPVSVQFDALPLKSAMEQLSQQVDRPLLIDQKALIASQVSVDDPVTLHLPNAKFSAVLKLMLQPLGLLYEMQKDGSIKITSRKAGAQSVQQDSYAVLPLVTVQLANGGKGVDAASLIQVVQSVQPDSWDINGGFGTIQYQPSGQLEISQIQSVHRLLQQLLADLRQSTKTGK
jgi:hypothetical protein